MKSRTLTILAALSLLGLCSRVAADPISSWTEELNGGFSLHLSGNLTLAEDGNGLLWSGTLLSPSGDWSINYGGGFVRRGLGYGDTDPNPNYTFVADSISGESLAGGRDLRMATGGGYACTSDSLAWGSGNGWAMILGEDSAGWEGSTYITFTAASDILDFSTWQWEADIFLHNPELTASRLTQGGAQQVPDAGASTALLLGFSFIALVSIRAAVKSLV